MKIARLTTVSFFTLALVSCANFSCPLPPKNIPPLFLRQPEESPLNLRYRVSVPIEVLSNLPKEITLYRFVPQNVTEGEFRSLARQFGMTTRPIRSIDRKTQTLSSLFLRQGRQLLWVDVEAGTWRFDDFQTVNSAEENYSLSDAEVERIATQYLKNKGWLPPDLKFQAVTAISHLSQCH